MNEFPTQLLWLADAPLFIDEKQIEAFYDAVLQPDYEEIRESLNLSTSGQTTIGGKISAEAAFPWLAKLAGEGSASHVKAKGEDRGMTWSRVSNPYRHLLALVLRYTASHDLKRRLVFAGEDGCADATGEPIDLEDESYPQETPRALIMLDLPPGTALIPAALELTNGKVVPLFKTLAERLRKVPDEPLPEYPDDSDPNAADKRIAYWNWFVSRYDRHVALGCVEEAVKDAPIAWIDYRFPLEGRYPHLHVAGRGLYETGVFGYQLIARGSRHGVRIVGLLKSEPDINVLAIFER